MYESYTTLQSTSNFGQVAKCWWWCEIMVSFLEVVAAEDWDEVWKRIGRLQSCKTIKEALRIIMHKHSVPNELVYILIGELKFHGGDPRSVFVGVFQSKNDFHYSGSREYQWIKMCVIQSPPFIETVLRECDSGIGPASTIGPTIFFLWRRHFFPVRSDFQRQRFGDGLVPSSKQNELLSISSFTDLKHHNDLHELWEKTVILIKSARKNCFCHGQPHRRITNEDGCLVHDMIKLGLPAVVIWLALRMHPYQALKRDSKGWLPLHYAVHGINGKKHLDAAFNGDLQIANETSLVEMILSFAPEAASYHDDNGRLPIIVHLLGRSTKKRPAFPESKIEIIDALISAAPDVLQTRDTTTGMYPFMLAASSGRSIDVVYSLLRSNPLGVIVGIRPTRYEMYLEKKLKESEASRNDLQSRYEIYLERKIKSEVSRDELQIELDKLRESKKRKLT